MPPAHRSVFPSTYYFNLQDRMLQRIKHLFGFLGNNGAPSNNLPDNRYPPWMGQNHSNLGHPPWLHPPTSHPEDKQVMPPDISAMHGFPPYHGFPYLPMMYPGFPYPSGFGGFQVPAFPGPVVQASALAPASTAPTSQPLSKAKEALPISAPGEVKKEPELHTPKDGKVKQILSQENQIRDDSFDWPNGEQRRECMKKNQPPMWKDTKWAWRSIGGRKVEQRKCLGVYRCSNSACGRLIRPKTQPDAQQKQIDNGCRICHSPVLEITCDARTHHYEILKGDVVYMVWEHSGFHDHERPPGGRLSLAERNALDQQVSRKPTASAHVLRTGDTYPGSIPLPEISGKLANPRSARYELEQSQTRLGILPVATSKGGLAVLKALFDLQKEFEDPFIIDSSIHGPTFLAFQTPFMKMMLEKTIDSWNDQAPGTHLTTRHGFVTDGDHSYFREGVLNVTCVFNPVMLAWIPVLYTWILQLDIDHHRPHFRHIQETVVKYLQLKHLKFEPKYLLHVFDFSAAQRAAHAAEYVEAVVKMTPGFFNLTKASQENERAAYMEQALQAEHGCSFHFWESAERIKSNGALVPQAKSTQFNQLLHILEDKKTTQSQFDTTIATLNSEFPRITNWLSWWLRPTFRSMIFPAYSSVDPDISIKIPRTSNAAEHSHSLLHRSVGSDQDLIPGIQKLFLHVKELEHQYNSIKDGHYDPGAPRAYRPPGKPKWDENDGRAPDTEAALAQAPNLAPKTVNQRQLLSYKWRSPNSCFIDNGLEIWYRAYSAWPSNARTAFLASIPSHTFLSSLFYHYDRRLKQLSDNSTVTARRQTLSLMQSVTLDRVFDKWKLYSNRNEFGCAKTWLTHAVKDGNPDPGIQEYFGLTHHLVWECPNGHQFSTPNLHTPEIWFTINNRDMAMAHDIFGDHVTTSNYFQHYIPRSRGGNYDGGTTPIHLLKPEKCHDPSCTAQSSILSVSAHWPQILNINADIMRTDPHKIQFENTFSISDQSGAVTYELVGRILHKNGDHFISQLRIEGVCYSYNDMENEGQLVPSDNAHLLEEKDGSFLRSESVCYIYNQTSSKKQTARFTTEIRADYERDISLASITDLSELPLAPVTVSVVPDPVLMPPGPLHIALSAPTVHELPNAPEVLKSAMGAYPTEPYNLCDTCQLSQPDPNRPFRSLMVECTLCERKWHEDCISINENGVDVFLDDTWACPACVNPHGGRWDEVMLGQFILLKPNSSARFYPAKVLGRSLTQCVHVEWYYGNVYDTDDDPLVTRSVFTPLECLQAKYRDSFYEYTKENLGSIKWPIRLEEDAAEKYNYKNTDVRKTLEDAYGAVLEIMLGTRDHPIVNLYNKWMKNRLHSVKTIEEHQFNFIKQFRLEILPGDASLIEPFLEHLHYDTRNGNILVGSHWITCVAYILFQLAIIRGYLGRQPCDDVQIFYLAYMGFAHSDIAPDDIYSDAKKGTLRRLLTPPEKAVEASKSIRTIGVHLSLRRVMDKKDSLAQSQLIEAYAANGAPYSFFNTTASGLAGGPRFVPNRKIELPAPAATLMTAQVRPKPKPRGKAAKEFRVIKPAKSSEDIQTLKRSHNGEDLEGLRRSKRNKID